MTSQKNIVGFILTFLKGKWCWQHCQGGRPLQRSALERQGSKTWKSWFNVFNEMRIFLTITIWGPKRIADEIIENWILFFFSEIIWILQKVISFKKTHQSGGCSLKFVAFILKWKWEWKYLILPMTREAKALKLRKTEVIFDKNDYS